MGSKETGTMLAAQYNKARPMTPHPDLEQRLTTFTAEQQG